MVDMQRQQGHGLGLVDTGGGEHGARGMQQRDRIAAARQRHRHRARAMLAGPGNDKGRTGLQGLCDLVGQRGGRVAQIGRGGISLVRRFP
ncbi:hypothetical protein [Cupriavidus sp. H18C1]|uniref:hypothetical protein n=1 Tax=Cupriavidus sp. H18C1 TaxID=3241601 RepID=UPI003BB905BF